MKSLQFLILFLSTLTISYGQDQSSEQSRESMAVDATATQWSFQTAY